MRNKVSLSLLVAALLVLAPWTDYALAQQKRVGVAGGDRVARGKNGRQASSPRHSPEDSPAPSDGEPTSAVSSRRLVEIESLEQQCLDEINLIRRAQSLAPLDFYKDLLPVARAYSHRMAEERFFSHNDPEGRTVRERVGEANITWRMVGENLAYSNGYTNPVSASLHGWMESPGHRKNILDPDYRLTAIGAWISADGTVYFTEIFLTK